MANVIALGEWIMGEPLQIAQGLVCTYHNAAGDDWYKSVAWKQDRPKGTAVIVHDDGKIFSAGHDVSHLHPIGGRVFVLEGFTYTDLVSLMGKTLNTDTGEIS